MIETSSKTVSGSVLRKLWHQQYEFHQYIAFIVVGTGLLLGLAFPLVYYLDQHNYNHYNLRTVKCSHLHLPTVVTEAIVKTKNPEKEYNGLLAKLKKNEQEYNELLAKWKKHESECIVRE
jgi:hypothetical protein